MRKELVELEKRLAEQVEKDEKIGVFLRTGNLSLGYTVEADEIAIMQRSSDGKYYIDITSGSFMCTVTISDKTEFKITEEDFDISLDQYMLGFSFV